MCLCLRSIRTAFFAVVLSATALALVGCVVNTSSSGTAEAAATPVPVPAPASDALGVVDYSCTTDADCTVKNVGNCCGYYPACVNINSPTFPEQVMAECARNDMMAVCGFPDIAGCQCVEGRCSALGAGGADR